MIWHFELQKPRALGMINVCTEQTVMATSMSKATGRTKNLNSAKKRNHKFKAETHCREK